MLTEACGKRIERKKKRRKKERKEKNSNESDVQKKERQSSWPETKPVRLYSDLLQAMNWRSLAAFGSEQSGS